MDLIYDISRRLKMILADEHRFTFESVELNNYLTHRNIEIFLFVKIKTNDISFTHSTMFVNASEMPFNSKLNYVSMCLKIILKICVKQKTTKYLPRLSSLKVFVLKS